jgi:diguanylate cyclase (GGDEF)-like protein/PAS domain S-box-containing protein
MKGLELRHFIERAPVAAAMFDIDMRYVAVSSRWLIERQLDISIIGKTAYEVFPDLGESFKSRHRRALQGEVVRAEDHFSVAHGCVQWVRSEVHPWIGDDGKVGGVVVFAEDITQEFLAKEALTESESLSNAIFECTPDCVCILDVNGAVEMMNGPGRRLLELDDSPTVIGRAWRSMFAKEEHQQISEALDQAAGGGTARFQAHCETVRGETKWWDVIMTSLRNTTGAVDRVLCVSREITEMKRVQDDLKQSAERLNLAQTAAQIATWDWDVGTSTSIVSDQYYEIFGLPEGGPHFYTDFLEQTHPDDRERVAAVMEGILATGGTGEAELRIIRASDGEVRWIKSRGTVKLNEKGEPFRAIGVIYDITKLKRTEEALLESKQRLDAYNRELEQKVAERTRELSEQANALRIQKQEAESAQRRFERFMNSGAFRAWIKDADGRYAYFNNAFVANHLTGHGDLRALTDYDIFPRHIASKLRQHDEMAFASEAPIQFEEKIIGEDGQSHFFLSSKFSFPDAAGKRYTGGVAIDITERKELEIALRKSEEHFRRLADMSPVPIAICGADEAIRYLNPAFTRAYGYELEDLPTVDVWFETVYPDAIYRDSIQARWSQLIVDAAFNKTEVEPIEVKMRCKNGDERSVVIGTNFLDEGRKAMIGTFFDVTASRAEEERIKRLSRLYAASSECQDAIVHSTSSRELYVRVCEVLVRKNVAKMAWVGVPDSTTNAILPAFCFGGDAAVIDDMRVSLDPQDQAGQGPTADAARQGHPVWRQDLDKDASALEWLDRARARGWRSAAALPLTEKGRICGVLTVYFDLPLHFDEEIQALLLKISDNISFALNAFAEQVEHEEANRQIEKLAHYDALTGLPNRYSFGEVLERKVLDFLTRTDRTFAVQLIDLDNFKDINDTLGHIVGDRFLAMVGKRLRASVRSSDLVCRIGGDEFVVIQTGIRNSQEAALLAEKLLKKLSDPYVIGENRIVSSGTIGISVYRQNSATAEELMTHADVALYRAKARQRGGFAFFTEEMDSAVRTRVELVGQLRNALSEGQLLLHYQPQFETNNGHILGVEALIRWLHPTRGVVGPDEFIPIAEDSGMILDIGEWVMKEACRQMKTWVDQRIDPPMIAINVSAYQIKKQLDFVGRLSSILQGEGLSPRKVEIELTESVLLDMPRTEDNVVNELRALGVSIALDDFGTGFSSLEYLAPNFRSTA